MSDLLPADLKNTIPSINSQEGSENPFVYAKFFFPAGNWTWFVTEGEPSGDDFLFFGFVIGLEKEWGYFTLNELEDVEVRGLTIERDLDFTPEDFSNCMNRWNEERRYPAS